MELISVKHMSFEEQNERLYYTQLKDSKAELSRRKFIKYLTVGSAGLLLPMGVNDAKAGYWYLVPAVISIIEMLTSDGEKAKEYSKNEEKSCSVALVNGSHKTAKGNLECGLHKLQPDLAYIDLNKLKLEQNIEPKHTTIVQINMNSASEPGEYMAKAKTQFGSKNTKFEVANT